MSAKQHPDPNVLYPLQTLQSFRNMFQIFFHTRIGKSTMTFLTGHYHAWRVLKSWCGTQNKDFGAVSQTDLTRVKFHRFCGAGLSKYRPEMARWFNCHFFNFLIVLMYIYSTSIDAEAVKTNRSSIVNITSGNPWRHSISGLPVSPLAT